jgi:hypothetical protein
MSKITFQVRAGRIVAALCIVLLLSACERTPALASTEARPVDPSPSIPHAREADDTARYLAGLPGNPGSTFAELEKTEAWQAHRDGLDRAWGKAETDLVGKLKAFEKQELNDPRWDAPVFYPFGGPDALTVTLLFPRSPSFTIVGLEPAGTLPAVRQFEHMDQAKYLAETRQTMTSVLGKSFFVTREMDKEFRGQTTDGLLLPILQLLVRTHHRVLGFRYVRLDENGGIIERAADYVPPTRYGNKGVEVEFETEGDSAAHTLRYFSANLTNGHLAEDKPFLVYLSHLRGVTTFLKATSYMTHRAEFSTIRNAVLADSANVLQDDSGIPYANFLPEVWDVQLYGEYTRPYGSFKWLEQPDLHQAFGKPGVKPLPLRLGYGYGRVASNLLMGTRK